MKFIDNNDGTITDAKTNLMWCKTGLFTPTLQDAKNFVDSVHDIIPGNEQCDDLSIIHLYTKQYKDWRIPTSQEILHVLTSYRHEYKSLRGLFRVINKQTGYVTIPNYTSVEFMKAVWFNGGLVPLIGLPLEFNEIFAVGVRTK